MVHEIRIIVENLHLLSVVQLGTNDPIPNLFLLIHKLGKPEGQFAAFLTTTALMQMVEISAFPGKPFHKSLPNMIGNYKLVLPAAT